MRNPSPKSNRFQARFRNTEQRFGIVSIALHWLIALLMIGVFIIGWVVVDIIDYLHPWYNLAMMLHESFGMVVLLFAFGQIVWLWVSPLPKPLPTLSAWEVGSAKLTHALLVTMMLLIPITGYGISAYGGQTIHFFGWFKLPSWVPEVESLDEWAVQLHIYFAYGTGCLVLLHIGAALKHHFVDKDATLNRIFGRY